MAAQPSRRGILPVSPIGKEGGRKVTEGRVITPDVTKRIPRLIMGDEGVPNPSQYFPGEQTRK